MTSMVREIELPYEVLPATGLSDEAGWVRQAIVTVRDHAERSLALFGAKAAAISDLHALMNESDHLSPIARAGAEALIRALPKGIPLPEFAPEPDGSISCDWIASQMCFLSVSVGEGPRLAYAWVDGTDGGHAVARFDGERVPSALLGDIRRIMNSAPVRP